MTNQSSSQVITIRKLILIKKLHSVIHTIMVTHVKSKKNTINIKCNIKP